jgi:hypothetical protein
MREGREREGEGKGEESDRMGRREEDRRAESARRMESEMNITYHSRAT